MNANTKPDYLAEANPILLCIKNKVKAVVAYINEFILRDKFYYITRNQIWNKHVGFKGLTLYIYKWN